MAFTVLVLICVLGWQLWNGSRLSIKTFGFHFLVSSDWDPVNDAYGALPFIFGTLPPERRHRHLSH
jgi:phosphate transport system permease protein